MTLFQKSIGLLVFLFLFSCQSSNEIQERKQTPEYQLKVSKYHQNFFVMLNKDTYTNAETRSLFPKMNVLGNQYCYMLWGLKRFRMKVASKFIYKEVILRHRKKFDPLHNLVSGCWNFYRMNDIHPEEDFNVALKLIPEKQKACYSVGFMQPYFMHSVLNCSRLTMIDIDWRIHYGHAQMLNLFQKNKMSSPEQVWKNIQSLKLGWQARYDNNPMEEKMKAAITTVCFPKYKKLCTNQLVRFQKKFRKLSHIEFQLSALHLAKYQASNRKTAIVAFFSNAIDDNYTSKKDFKTLMKNISESLLEGQNMYFIHHAAGRRLFGIYRFHKQNGKSTLTTLCRDIYLTAPVSGKTKPYLTHFDRFTSSKTKVPRCHSLLKKAKTK